MENFHGFATILERRKQNDGTRNPRWQFPRNAILLPLALPFEWAPSRAKMIIHQRREQKNPRKPALCNWLRFSLETIMSYRCRGCRPVTRRNGIIVGLEDTNKSGISRHCGRYGGVPSSAVTFNHQGRNFLVPLRRYKLIIHVRLRQAEPGRL